MQPLKDYAGRRTPATPLTLADLIEYLDGLPRETVILLDADLDSYRGYYSEVALPPGRSTAGELKDHLRERVYTQMTGYKGGTYNVLLACRVYVAYWGELGPRLYLVDGELYVEEEAW